MGRSRQCDLRLPHSSVSHTHAEIENRPTALIIRDLSSRNGTFVNGRRAMEHRFLPGDTLRLGSVTLDVIAGTNSAPDLEDPETTPLTSPRNIPGKRPGDECLSVAERPVLRLLLRGLSEREVALALDLSPATVHTHVGHIYRKFGVDSRSELMALFVDQRAESNRTS
ncbi:MAG: FHA domain-containing protein [Planctomycetes bacterium]|nr:FHA domain-containing protein [Planctomycetota bacterium]